MTKEQERPVGRTTTEFGDGHEHGLKPLSPVEPGQARSVNELLSQMANTAFGGRQLGEACDIATEMFNDDDCLVICTVSGAMTVAQMGLVLTEMLERKLVDAVISTGALMSHGFIEEAGRTKFKRPPDMDDATLFRLGYNRVYDSIELESSFDYAGRLLWDWLADFPRDAPFSSYQLCQFLGDKLLQSPGRGILQAAAKNRIPIYIPALTDSELGLVIYEYNTDVAGERGQRQVLHDPFLDLAHYVELLSSKPRRGIFTIGGGVPRNWAQQVGPLVDAMQRRHHGTCTDPMRFRYGVRICPEPVHWGGLSGCTYSEGVSWGKFIPHAEGGRFAEVIADATIAWPILMRAVYDRLDARRA